MSIKTNFEFPRGKNLNDDLKQSQRLAQDLSKNFKAISKALGANITNNFVSGIDAIKFSSEYSIICPIASTASVTYTFTHNLGTVPTGFILTDITSSNAFGMTNPVLTRDSWTTTEIVIRLSVYNSSTAGTQSGDFKILVLR